MTDQWQVWSGYCTLCQHRSTWHIISRA